MAKATVGKTDQATPANGAPEYLRALEQDIRALMLELSSSRGSAKELERRQTEQMVRFLSDMVEIPDAFERVFQTIHAKEELVTPQMKIWIGNFRSACRLVDKVLSDQGLVKIENLDQGFDPKWHKAVDVVVDTSKPEGTILQQIKPGYMWRGQVIRKAEVVVVAGSKEAASNSNEGG